MSDHIDGPRQIGDPSADLTDLFAFTSPENPVRTVLAANAFPTCGIDANFSDAINHAIVVRRAKVAALLHLTGIGLGLVLGRIGVSRGERIARAGGSALALAGVVLFAGSLG